MKFFYGLRMKYLRNKGMERIGFGLRSFEFKYQCGYLLYDFWEGI